MERCELADELSSVKVKLAVAEKELLESQEKNAQLSKSYDEDTQMLKDQVENVMKHVLYSQLPVSLALECASTPTSGSIITGKTWPVHNY